jgi:cobalt-zinc-cadmium efflux system outer membrane protein
LTVRIMKLAAVLSTLIASVVPARADDAVPVRTLLADPGQLAAWLGARDPVLEAARAKVEAASALGEQARVLPNPQVQLSTGGYVLGTTNASDGSPGSGNPRLGLGQTTNYQLGIGELIELGKRGHRQHAADARAREAGEMAVGTLGARLGDATAALGKLTYVAAKREAMAQNLEAATKLRDNEKIRVDNKDLSPLEFGRIELDTQELELQLGRAEAELSSAAAACSAALYATCSVQGLDVAALDNAAPLPAALPETAGAIEQRPARLASKLEASALGYDAELANARAIPDPTIGVSYLLDNLVVAGNQHQQLLFSLGFALPVFDRGNHDAAAAHANAHAIEAQERADVREAHGLVEALLAQRTTLQTTLQRLEADSVPKSTQIILQTRKAFDLGQARLVDLLLVERAHRDLLLEVLDTRFDLFTVRAQLRQALGLDDQLARSASTSASRER